MRVRRGYGGAKLIMSTTVGILSGLAVAGVLLLELWFCHRAPLGYEDPNGFHEGRPSPPNSDEIA